MTDLVPATITDARNDSVVVDAIYFTVRALRNGLRNYPATPVSTEPAAEVRDLAQAAVREIETKEGRPIRELGSERLLKYISDLEQYLRLLFERRGSVDRAQATSILDDLRSQSL